MTDSFFEIFEDDLKVKIPQKFIKETPRTEVKDSFFINNTRHETIIPFGSEYIDLPHEPACNAKTYKFELDTFQKLSLSSIERDESVLVSAHTSCGKTVVAEYAIAKSIKNNQRVVYTSPIKALSNQKFRELQEEFNDVGLMTGDVTINPEASCLVMTTEILRNMLYRGSEVIREVHWLIFDEIHYMRDKERGVVWEEAIILLPKHVRMVFLSATIPNAQEFAEWIAYIQNQIVHVVYTEKRVIPLIYYFFTDQQYLIQDSKFHAKAFQKSMRDVPSKKDLGKIMPVVIEKANLPAVVFSFGRKDCETLAMNVSKDFLNVEEKELVKTIFDNALSSLREEDRQIKIIESMLPLLQRGIGIHHSGLLPIIREVVEILFQESLVKILFATETFSIGLNMPAKTVIFTAFRKFDGVNRRLITSGEFIQMSGRAGRRGIDEKGDVICILTEELSPAQVKKIFSSNTDKLLSAFKLTYNMILNLLRVEGLEPTYILSRSFFHFQAYKSSLEQENKIKNTEYRDKTKLASLFLEREELYKKRNLALSSSMLKYIKDKGRVVKIMIPNFGSPLFIDNAIVGGVCNEEVNVYLLTNKDIECRTYPTSFVCEVYESKFKVNIKVFSKKLKPLPFDDPINNEIKIIEKKIKKIDKNVDLGCCLFCKAPSRACLINCVFDDNGSAEYKEAIAHLIYLRDNNALQAKIEELKKLKEIYHMEECRKMTNVLKKMEYIDDTSILIKGKMASEISACDELVITEMIFNSKFPYLPLIDMVALLSCLVCEEKSSDGAILSEENDKLFSIIVETSKKVCNVKIACGLEVKVDDYIKRFSFELMDIVKMWMSGRTFVEICGSTSVFEGSIIRTFKRLEELLRQLSNAAAVIGNNDLVDLFGQGIFLIKRDIIFANSLYL